jgi:putative mRNA 3-end processing factor
MNGVRVSLHPAGHCMGSAQVRVEHAGEVWVVSGDYKRGPDPYAVAFEPVRCHTFITESTFGLPIYHWPSDDDLVRDILRWADVNAACGLGSVLRCYPLGKAQRLIGLLAPHCSLTVDASIERTNAALGLIVPAPSTAERTLHISSVGAPSDGRAYTTAFASGWTLTEPGRARGAGVGFAVSDHADWEGLVQSVRESEAERILVTHGFEDEFASYLRGEGHNAEVLR